jgi:hypothetical protein
VNLVGKLPWEENVNRLREGCKRCAGRRIKQTERVLFGGRSAYKRSCRSMLVGQKGYSCTQWVKTACEKNDSSVTSNAYVGAV